MADRISDAVLDEALSQDKNSRVACETLLTTDLAVIAGEITTTGYIDMEKVARNAVKDIGYTSSEMGFNWQNFSVQPHIHSQSTDISQGVTQGEGLHSQQGAGDQGMMFGFACSETPTLMPAPIYYAHKLTEQLSHVRKQGVVDYFYPDGKSQVSLSYDENNNPSNIDAIVIAQQHADGVEHDKIQEDIIEHVIKKVIPSNLLDPMPTLHINATGRFVTGGPHGDCGLTGRKIIVDTYGGYARHGGGAFSGKDPSKVDRSAAYAARCVAKNVVSAGLASRCEFSLAYSIGVDKPVSLDVNTFGTNTESEDSILGKINSEFDLTPSGIIDNFDLKRPIYSNTSAYGHFGREHPDFTWEKVDLL
ncbi:MAG: methionine adenosyltransferase [Marine Group III euryarchaeote CG-Bathy1]|uniref:Methionine adenosyltransferase n=1 Tax=Marine Group III euryarchaeote CG-Bathy1 TaxID=1889001 RepID=A0A1J5SZR0_9ARCH|nr:MAG: methionine adenosyltransferase [Marine Group III euryarchaeote CG-Bathy1]